MNKYAKTAAFVFFSATLIYIVLWVALKYDRGEISTTDFFLGLIFANLTAKSCMNLLKD